MFIIIRMDILNFVVFEFDLVEHVYINIIELNFVLILLEYIVVLLMLVVLNYHMPILNILVLVLSYFVLDIQMCNNIGMNVYNLEEF